VKFSSHLMGYASKLVVGHFSSNKKWFSSIQLTVWIIEQSYLSLLSKYLIFYDLNNGFISSLVSLMNFDLFLISTESLKGFLKICF